MRVQNLKTPDTVTAVVRRDRSAPALSSRRSFIATPAQRIVHEIFATGKCHADLIDGIVGGRRLIPNSMVGIEPGAAAKPQRPCESCEHVPRLPPCTSLPLSVRSWSGRPDDETWMSMKSRFSCAYCTCVVDEDAGRRPARHSTPTLATSGTLKWPLLVRSIPVERTTSCCENSKRGPPELRANLQAWQRPARAHQIARQRRVVTVLRCGCRHDARVGGTEDIGHETVSRKGGVQLEGVDRQSPPTETRSPRRTPIAAP